VFIVYPILLAVPLGWLLGGSLERLGTLHVRWWPVALLGLAVQVVLFADPVAERVGALGTPLYVGSTLAVLAVVVRNLRIAGFPLIVLGAGSNMLAILANGGCMPTTPAAILGAGDTLDGYASPVYSNSCLLDAPALAPLTDVLYLPAWMPLANVFSIGDAVIGLGVAVAIVAGMRHRGPRETTRIERPVLGDERSS
jgi:hypothetical protein